MFVEFVFGCRQQTGILHLLIFDASFHDRLQYGACLVHVACIAVSADHVGIQLVAFVGGDVQSSACPSAVGNFDAFCQIDQTDDVACIRCLSSCIGHPYFNAVDRDAAGDVWKGGAGFVVDVVEVMGKEEVTVFVIVVCLNVIRAQLVTSLTADSRRFCLLLACNSLQFQTSKL